jgi:mannuronan 5-epimerase
VSFYDPNAIVATLLGKRKIQQVIWIISICQWISIILVPQGTLSYIQNAGAQQQYMESDSCITYDPAENTIRISCGFADLTSISNQLKNPDLLHKETTNGVWLLDAGIVIEQGATLYINSTDTSWLKIAADGETAHAITVLGSLKIDSIKITSWDPETNDYLKFEFDILPSREYEKSGIDAIPRPYILVEEEATGTTDITNSEIAYLGYTCGGGCSGLTYYGGEGSIVKGNEIHHNRFGFYSKAVGGLILEGNHVHDNFMYGFDPHTGTHDMVIRNNTVHNHGAMGIICSVDCYI